LVFHQQTAWWSARSVVLFVGSTLSIAAIDPLGTFPGRPESHPFEASPVAYLSRDSRAVLDPHTVSG
jgi:hypothetical protein